MIYTLTLNPALDLEYSVPALTPNTVLRSPSARSDWGGKGFNVSRMLGVLGTPSTALGFVGGTTGQRLEAGLRALGIDTDFVWLAGETRTNVSVVAREEDAYLKVNEPGPDVSPAEQAQLLDKVDQLAQKGDWWVLSGSTPPGVGADYYATMIRRLNAAGAHTLLDTSGAALQLGCAAGPTVAKPNDIELAQLTGSDALTSTAALVAAARALRAAGVAHVVVSRGRQGALLVDEGGVWRGAPPKIVEKNPIGAGDAMVAGLTYALARNAPVPEALGWGMACGAAAAAQDGTGMGPAGLVHDLKNETQIEVLDAIL